MDASDSVFSNLEDEVYARVMWGEPPGEICDWLCNEHGLPRPTAEALVNKHLAERSAEIRLHGLRSIAGAIGVIVLCGVPMILMLTASRMIHVGLLGVLGTGVAYGVYRLVVALWRLASGRDSSAIADME